MLFLPMEVARHEMKSSLAKVEYLYHLELATMLAEHQKQEYARRIEISRNYQQMISDLGQELGWANESQTL